MGDSCHCGCGGSTRDNCGCNSMIWIILLLFLCGGCSDGSDCGGSGLSSLCGGGCESIIIILLLLSCCGNGCSIC